MGDGVRIGEASPLTRNQGEIDNMNSRSNVATARRAQLAMVGSEPRFEIISVTPGPKSKRAAAE